MMRIVVRGVTSVLLLGGLAACGTPTGVELQPVVTKLDAQGELVMKFGADVRVEGTMLRLTFSDVGPDSRCPVNVTCVWAGDLEAELGAALGMGPTVAHDLHLNGEVGQKSVVVGTHRITLLSATPEARANVQIAKRDYSIRLRIQSN